MSCYHIGECLRCTHMYEAVEDERDRLLALIGQMKEETVKVHYWGQRLDVTVCNIEHLIACALAPAPNKAINDTTTTQQELKEGE